MRTTEPPLPGDATRTPAPYDPTLLCPIPRSIKRREIGVGAQPLFVGADLWTAFELSWLNLRGKPQVAIAHFTVPAESPNIVEGKSLELYLGGLTNMPFAAPEDIAACLRKDLSAAAWHGSERTGSVGVRLLLAELLDREVVHELDGLSLDRLDIECTQYTPAPELLRAAQDALPVQEVLTSNLLQSKCPVTGQSCWGSVRIAYSGPQIDQERLLQYLVSFRNHHAFHEQCVERIFMDLWTRCQPVKLEVVARFTRRGGLDINPWRSSHPQALPANIRTARQ